MGNCCCGVKEKTVIELYHQEIKNRKTQILPGDIPDRVKERIQRDERLKEEDKLKPSVKPTEYNIES